VPYSSFENCIKIKERSALEPDAIEYKCYSPFVKLDTKPFLHVTADSQSYFQPFGNQAEGLFIFL